MGQVFRLFLLVSIISNVSLFSQTAEEFLIQAKETYPDHQKSIGLLELALAKEPNNLNCQLAKAKIEFLFGKIDKKQVFASFNKALQLDPDNAYTKSWIVYAAYQYDEIKAYSPLLLEVYEASKTDKNLLYYFVNFMVSRYKQVKFKNEHEIFQRLQKGPASFESQTALYCFYLSKTMFNEAKKEFYKVAQLNKNQILPKAGTYDLFSPKSLPYVNTKLPYDEYDLVLREQKKHSLVVRLAYEKRHKSHFRFMHQTSIFGSLSQNFSVEGNILESFLALGKYQDILDFNQSSSASDRFYYVCEALNKMGLFNEALNFSKFLEKPHSKSEKILAAGNKIKALVMAREFSKAQTEIENFKINDVNENFLFHYLYCAYYSTLEDTQNWLKHYKKLKKFVTYASFIEINTQMNNLGHRAKNAFSELSKEDIRRYKKIVVELLYSQANSSLISGKNKESIKWIVTAKSASPNDIRNTFEQAKYFFKTAELDKALYRNQQFLSEAPNDMNGLILKGMIALEQEKYEEANKAFSLIRNKSIAHYYLLVSLFCKNGPEDFLNILKKNPLSSDYPQAITLLHTLDLANNKESANDKLAKIESQLQQARAHYYSKYKLGKISLEEYQKHMNFGPVLKTSFNFTIGFEAMQNEQKEKAIEHFKKCLIPYSIDMPEYHMAKACLKTLEK